MILFYFNKCSPVKIKNQEEEGNGNKTHGL